MIAAAEGLLIIALIMGILTTSLTVATNVGNYSDMSAQGRIAMSVMERDLRATYALTLSTPAKMQFVLISKVTDYNAPTPPAITFKYITYEYNAGEKLLARMESDDPSYTLGAKKTTLLRDLKSSQFAYFNGNDAEVTTASQAKKVLIQADMERGRLGKLTTDNLVSAVVVLRAR